MPETPENPPHRPPETPPPLGPDRLGDLLSATNGLLDEVHQLAEESGGQLVSLTERAEKDRRVLSKLRRFGVGLAVSVALDVALSVIALLGYHQVQTQNVRISGLTDRLNAAQTVQRQKALCPLYGLFLASENPKSRAVYPQGPAAYDKAFLVIRQGYDALSCSSFIVKVP